jgi:A/G-specific adenine glycosylase
MSLSPSEFRAALLAWFQPELRQMPWRASTDPYQIWISEIMLQQTQVETVKPYFQRFLAAFPTVQALAEAPLADVLRLWQGLGYYSRARHLHRGARQVWSEYGGELPRTPEGLRKIPGIGPYTAGAIASIAFSVPAPAIDGNVLRVLSRYLALNAPVDKPSGRQPIEAALNTLIDPLRPGDFNQALMELGATRCTPRKPACGVCPLQEGCQAWQQRQPERYPLKASRPTVRALELQVGIIRWQNRLLIQRQTAKGLFEQLWIFPQAEALSELQFLLEQRLGLTLSHSPICGGQIQHTLTHRQLTLVLQDWGQLAGEPPALPLDWDWLNPDQASDWAMPVAHRKVLTQIL